MPLLIRSVAPPALSEWPAYSLSSNPILSKVDYQPSISLEILSIIVCNADGSAYSMSEPSSAQGSEQSPSGVGGTEHLLPNAVDRRDLIIVGWRGVGGHYHWSHRSWLEKLLLTSPKGVDSDRYYNHIQSG